MPEYTVVPPSSPGQPTFLRGPNLIEIKIPVLPTYGGIKMNATELANAINAQMKLSPTYAAQFTDPTIRAEGATIWFKGQSGPSLIKGKNILDHVGTPAISQYPLNPGGTFKNSSAANELGVVYDNEVFVDGDFRYELIARILPEEISVHPRLGSHRWAPATVTTPQVLMDPVWQVMNAIQRENGLPYFVPVNGAILPARSWVISVDSLPKYIAANPKILSADEATPSPGTRLRNGILVVSNADFDTLRAEADAQGVRARARKQASPFVPFDASSLPNFVTPEQAQAQLASLVPPDYAADIVNVIGSALGGYLFSQSPVTQVIGTALLQTVGQNVVQAFYQGGLEIDVALTFQEDSAYLVKSNVLDNFGSEFANAVRGAAIGSFSSLLSLELGSALGLKGFGAELFQQSASTVIGQVLNNAVGIAQGAQGATLFSGLNTDGLFGSVKGGAPGLLPGAIGSFFGAKLGSLILAPTSTEGVALASIGSGVGVIALTSGAAAFGIGSFAASLSQVLGGLANFGVPFVGSLAGFLLGSLIGRLFGRKKPRIPTASAEIGLDLQSGYWVSGVPISANGGNIEFAKEMASGARDAINAIISTIVGGRDIAPLGSTRPQRQKYGHSGSVVYVDELVGTSFVRRYSGSDASAAVDIGAVSAVRSTRIRGGDILAKRGLYHSTQTSIAALLGDLVVAKDYADYLVNKLFYNSFFQANPSSALTASWFATLARAEEIGLTAFQPSDFYGGLGGFAQSFGFGVDQDNSGLGYAYEALALRFEGSALRVITLDDSAPFEVVSGTNNIAGWHAAQSVYIKDFGVNVGYSVVSEQATAGNDIWIADDDRPVTMDDTSIETSGYSYYDAGMNEWYWMDTSTTVSGGDDIFVGSQYDDVLYGQTGWDWLDGGAGNDLAHGGSEDDVLLGRAGVDSLHGENGNDYLAGGDGDDHPAHAGSPYHGGLFGGDGNDTLVGGGGHDLLNGGNGDDLFIVEQDGGSTWDYHSGDAGSDTASFERFSAGIRFDLATGSGNGYTAITYGDGFVSIENVTGSQFNDVVYGDAANNVLSGLGGGDDLFGSGGDDVLVGGIGGDALNGGSGIDTISYEGSQQGVIVSLATGVGLGGDASGDSFAEVENVRGSAGNDELTGSSGDNVLAGGAGDDRLRLTSGSDNVEGGDGFDTLDASTPGYIGDLVTGASLLGSGAVLNPGQTVSSADGRYTLAYQSDGNLVLYGPSGVAWSNNVYGYSPGSVNMQSDGNLVVRSSSGGVAWNSGTPGNPGGQLFLDGTGRLSIRNAGRQLWESRSSSGGVPLLYSSENLKPGESAMSADGQFQLAHQGDGNVVLYGPSGAIWSTDVYGHAPGNLAMQSDGNLVVYDAAGNARWSSITAGQTGSSLFLNSSGRLTINNRAGAEAWATGPGPGLTVYHDDLAGAVASINGAITTFSGIESFIGTAYADYISGSAADEVFEGGKSGDALHGGEGSDTYVLSRGDGYDGVQETNTGANAISVQGDVNWRDIAIFGAKYWIEGSNLDVQIRGTTDGIFVANNYYFNNLGSNAGMHNHAIKTLNLNGVSTIDINMIDYTPDAAYDASTTVLGAQNHADLIFALGGDDTIYAAGNSTAYEIRGNVIYAGDGNDAIFSSSGDDQFIFERGNGIDTLTDQGGADTLVMGPSVAADDVIYEVVNTWGSSGEEGSAADLYIAIRDPNSPDTSASQVADRVRIVGGGTRRIGAQSGTETLNTIEHVRVGGQEIDLTKANINWTVSYYYDGGTYPIALDLDGDGIELRSVEGSRITTVEADGTVTRMGWLGQDDGFLGLDRDGNGVIDRIGEISFVDDKEGAKTDLEGLAAYDSNGDGKLDATDARWGDFKVWQDKNQDGLGTKGELVGLEKAGLTSISLKGQLTGFTAADGPDNTVIATTDVVWKDANRTGSAYDVMLARLQVRADGGGEGIADLDALARGTTADELEAKLRGIQSLTSEQVAAINDKRARQTSNDGGGRFYRAEELLGVVASTVTNGLYSIDTKVAQTAVDLARRLSVGDRFANSEWSKLGSTVLGEGDMRGPDALLTKVGLSEAQKVVIGNAQKIVANRKVADEAKAAEQLAKDARDATSQPVPTLPTAEEIEELRKTDTFQLLQSESDTYAPGATRAADQQQLPASSAADSFAQMAYAEDNGAVATEASDEAQPRDAKPNNAPQRSFGAEPATQGSTLDSAESPEIEAYGVVIRAANARLVQALASLGDAPAMMASYQGLNVANDPQAAWLSVDTMPSIQRLTAIR